MDKDEVMDALKALAEEGDEQAQRMLAAMAEAPAEDEEEAPASERGEDQPSAEDPPADEEDDKDKGPSASAPVDLFREVVALKREVLAIKQTDERKALMAKRPDLTSDPKYRAYMEQLSLKDLRQAVALTPKNPLPNPAAVATVPVSRGKDQGKASTPELSADEPDVDLLMGLRAEAPKIERKDGHTYFARMTPAQAKAAAASKAK